MKKLLYLPFITICLLLNSCAEPTQEEIANEMAVELGYNNSFTDHIKFSEYDIYQWALAEDYKKVETEYLEMEGDETKVLELFGVKEKMQKIEDLVNNELPLKGTSKDYDVYKYESGSEFYYIVLKGNEKKTLFMQWMNKGL